MDKTTIIGFVLIALILIGFSVMNKPSEEEIRYQDSIALVQKQKYEQEIKVQEAAKAATAAINNDSTIVLDNDSARLADAMGDFSAAAFGEEKFYTIENEVLKLTFRNKGGRIYSAQLKNYRTHDSLPLVLFDAEESKMGFILTTNNNRVVNTSDLIIVTGKQIGRASCRERV